MIVFVGMETSGAMRRLFQAAGHYTVSCDVLPSEDGSAFTIADGGHIVGDVYATLVWLRDNGIWPDLGIFHPTCTYLTISAAWAFNDPDFIRYPGVGYHQRVQPGTLTGAARRAARDDALAGVYRISELPIARKAMENPIGAINTRFRKATDITQPYEFGDDASKATCWWFMGDDGRELRDMIVPRDPAQRCPGRIVTIPRCKTDLDLGFVPVERWSNQTDSGQNRLSPGADRWKERSRTFPGLAAACVAHWSKLPPPARDKLL